MKKQCTSRQEKPHNKYYQTGTAIIMTSTSTKIYKTCNFIWASHSFFILFIKYKPYIIRR
jgi:hypothetical protein